MKKLVAVLFILLVIGCSGGPVIENVSGKVLVTIERSVSGKVDPKLYIAAENAYLDNDNIVIEGPISIDKNWGMGWVVDKMEIKDNKLIIPIPKKPEYTITIEKNN